MYNANQQPSQMQKVYPCYSGYAAPQAQQSYMMQAVPSQQIPYAQAQSFHYNSNPAAAAQAMPLQYCSPQPLQGQLTGPPQQSQQPQEYIIPPVTPYLIVNGQPQPMVGPPPQLLWSELSRY